MNYIINPSQNDIIHSAKGKDWKTHKYISKKKVNGKWVYIYKYKGGSIADKLGITAEKARKASLKEEEKASNDMIRNRSNMRAANDPRVYTSEKEKQTAKNAFDKSNFDYHYITKKTTEIIKVAGDTPLGHVGKAIGVFQNAIQSIPYNIVNKVINHK